MSMLTMSMAGLRLLLHQRQGLSFLTSPQIGNHMKTTMTFLVITSRFLRICNLKLLALDNVRLQHLEQLISKCHVLEWLSIQSCNQLHNLHVSEPLCRLQCLSIQGCHLQRMELHAPNLTTFEYDGSLALVTLNECSNIKASTIRLFDEKTLQNILTGIPSVLPHVETLYVEVNVKTQVWLFLYSLYTFNSIWFSVSHLVVWTYVWPGHPPDVWIYTITSQVHSIEVSNFGNNFWERFIR